MTPERNGSGYGEKASVLLPLQKDPKLTLLKNQPAYRCQFQHNFLQMAPSGGSGYAQRQLRDVKWRCENQLSGHLSLAKVGMTAQPTV